MTDKLAWFVDRKNQLDGFGKMARGETAKCILAVCAEQIGMGKTWLIQRIRQECQTLSLPTCYVDFRDRRAWDYLKFVRAARDQMGDARFYELTKTVNDCTAINIQLAAAPAAPSSVTVGAQGGTVGDVSVNAQGAIIAGGNVVVVKDNNLYVQDDSPIARQAKEDRITSAFFACLSQLATPQCRAVFLLDSYEEHTEEIDGWLRDQLLARLRDKQLASVIVVIAGATVPEFGVEWESVLWTPSLKPFTEADVREYISKRNLTGLDVATAFRMSGGLPGLLSQMADVAAMGSGKDEDTL